MASLLFANNAFAKLQAGIIISDTTITVQAGQGAAFPYITPASGDYFYMTLVDSSANREIVKCTAHIAGSPDSFTVTRAQDGTAARAFSIGDVIEARINAAILEDFQAVIEDLQTQITGNDGDISTNAAAIAVNAADIATLDSDKADDADLDAHIAELVADDVHGMGSMASQENDAVNIDGGDIDVSSTGSLKAGDVAALANKVVNIYAGTGSAPTASTPTRGTLWIKYVA
jgi:hypothetical protein